MAPFRLGSVVAAEIDLVRQTLVSTIYGGTSEIQRNIIAKA